MGSLFGGGNEGIKGEKGVFGMSGLNWGWYESGVDRGIVNVTGD
jgi:hypothetical protein